MSGQGKGLLEEGTMARVRVQTVRSTPRKVGLAVNEAVTQLERNQCAVRSIQFLPPFEETPGRTVVYAQIVFEFPNSESADLNDQSTPIPNTVVVDER